MTNEITTYLKYANLQMAAESLFGGTGSTMDVASLVLGNNRSSKFTEIQAQQFIEEGWTVAEHKSNTSTGFSGTLFRNSNTDELVLSFRSTEFIDDAARDNQATNSMEIKEKGWAFGQIADMKAWVDSLYTSGKITADKQLTVTGYSLGGHLATAFNMLYGGDADATYTFNGAGVGQIKSGHTLSDVIAEFQSLRTSGSGSRFTTPEVAALYQELRATINGQATQAQIDAAYERVDGLIDTYQPDPQSAPMVSPTVRNQELTLLRDALHRAGLVVAEAVRVPDLASHGASESPLDIKPELINGEAIIDATRLDYQLAVLLASRNTQPSVGLIGGGMQAVLGREQGAYTLPNFYDIYGDTVPSAVSNSQLHYGTATPIFIEDQPLLRGTVVGDAIAATLQAHLDVKLLVDGFSNNDFGDTHSLVLLVDSLSVQNTFAGLDPTLTADKMSGILAAASNQKADWAQRTQGKADGDTLESLVNALADTLGLGWTGAGRLEGSLDGNTWASVEDPGGHSGRSTFYQRLQQLTGSGAYKSLTGKVTIETAGNIASQARARDSFAEIAALQTLSPFIFVSAGEAGEAALDGLWQSGTWGESYNAWLQDKSLLSMGKPAATYTDGWIADRAEMLRWQITRNTIDVDPVRMPGVTESILYRDVVNATSFYLTNTNAGEPASLYTRRITFGGSTNDELGGADRSDHVYGGAGADTLNGGKGDDYLQGDAGNDTLDGGIDNDTLVGGEGVDTYVIGSDTGRDTVIDADGQGAIQLAGRSLTGGGELISTASAAQPYTVWLDDSNASRPIRYSLNSSTQELTITGAGSTVIVKNFTSGDLGISVPAATPPAVVPSQFTFDLSTSAGRTALAALTPEQSNANLRVNNAVFADARYLSTSGGAGDDTITGGGALSPAGTILNGGAGSDRIWAATETTLDAAIAAGETATPNGSATLMLAGNEGDDQLVGDAGDDVLFGGTGDDTLIGGAGADIILADGDNASYQSDDAVGAWSSGGNIFEGPDRWLRMRVHSARVGSTNTDSTGRRVVTEDHIDLDINPLANTDLSGLLAMRPQDIVPDAGDTNAYLSGTQLTYAQVNGGKAMATNLGTGADIIYAGAGDDTVNAGAGDDIVFAGTGIDAVAGYEGDDFIEGGEGADTLWGDYTAHNGNAPQETHTEFGATWTIKLELDPARHGRDFIDGGEGDDNYLVGSDGKVLKSREKEAANDSTLRSAA